MILRVRIRRHSRYNNNMDSHVKIWWRPDTLLACDKFIKALELFAR